MIQESSSSRSRALRQLTSNEILMREEKKAALKRSILKSKKNSELKQKDKFKFRKMCNESEMHISRLRAHTLLGALEDKRTLKIQCSQLRSEKMVQYEMFMHELMKVRCEAAEQRALLSNIVHQRPKVIVDVCVGTEALERNEATVQTEDSEQANEEVKQLAEENSSLQKKIAKLESEIVGWNMNMEILNEEIIEKIKENKQLKNESKETKKKYLSLLDESSQRESELKKEVTTYTAELERYERIIDYDTKKRDKGQSALRGEIAEGLDREKKLNDQVDELKARIVELEKATEAKVEQECNKIEDEVAMDETKDQTNNEKRYVEEASCEKVSVQETTNGDTSSHGDETSTLAGYTGRLLRSGMKVFSKPQRQVMKLCKRSIKRRESLVQACPLASIEKSSSVNTSVESCTSKSSIVSESDKSSNDLNTSSNRRKKKHLRRYSLLYMFKAPKLMKTNN